MNLAHFRMLIHELFNNNPDKVPEYAPLIILDSAAFMAKNGKDTNHTRHITIIVYFVSNGENCKMHKIYWCEGGLQFTDIATKNVGENDLNHRMKYIMVRINN